MKKRMFVLFLMVIALMAVAAKADLRLWYNFEENAEWKAGGYVQDQSTYANHGITQDAWSCGMPSYITSHDGSQAMLFGYGTYEGKSWNNVSTPKSDSIAHIGTQWSMGGWVRIDDVVGWSGYSAYPKIISTPNYEIIGNASGDNASYFWPWAQEANPWGTEGSWDMTTANIAAYNDTWMHMVETYDGTTFKQYINGTLAFTATDFAHQFDDTVWDQEGKYWTNDPMKIGAALAGYPTSSGWLMGALDDIGIRSDCISAAQVSALYDGTQTWAGLPEPATLVLLSLGGLLLRKR